MVLLGQWSIVVTVVTVVIVIVVVFVGFNQIISSIILRFPDYNHYTTSSPFI